MFYIVDNGEEYSDHCIYFIESSLSLKNFKKLVELNNSSHPVWRHMSHKITGYTDDIKWLHNEHDIQKDVEYIYLRLLEKKVLY